MKYAMEGDMIDMKVIVPLVSLFVLVVLLFPLTLGAQESELIFKSKKKKELRFLSVSPDGELLTYAVWNKKKHVHFLYFLNLVDKKAKPIKVSPGIAATFSSDGQSLVYYNDAKGDNKYWLTVIDRGGTDARDLGVSSISPESILPMFSPDGTQIVYGTAEGTFLVPPEGQVTEIVSSQMVNHPVWFPNSKAVVFERKGGGISILDLESRKIKKVTPDFKGFSPDVSPDGEKILVSLSNKIYQFELKTEKHTKVAEADRAVYSPDGRGLLLFRATGEVTSNETSDLPDYSIFFKEFGQEEIKISDKAHYAIFGTDGYTIFHTVFAEGIYRTYLPGRPEPVTEPEK